VWERKKNLGKVVGGDLVLCNGKEKGERVGRTGLRKRNSRGGGKREREAFSPYIKKCFPQRDKKGDASLQ